uniref:Bromo domain-containing protein n=1 Tax=Parastrongyloides trichosuri TaxID=131310 RepID=A0A0N4ZK82_PARTI
MSDVTRKTDDIMPPPKQIPTSVADDSKFVKPTGIPQKGKKFIYVEPKKEWNVMEYGLEGSEALIPPKSYQENLAEKASRINWKKIVGSNVTYDDPEEITDIDSDRANDLVDRILALKMHKNLSVPAAYVPNSGSKLIVKQSDLIVKNGSGLNDDELERQRINMLHKEANEKGIMMDVDENDYEEMAKCVDDKYANPYSGPIVINDVNKMIENNRIYENLRNQKYIEGEIPIEKKKKPKDSNSDDEEIGYMIGKTAVESFKEGRIMQELEYNNALSSKRVIDDPVVTSKIRYILQKRLSKKSLEYHFYGRPLQGDDAKNIFQILNPSLGNTFGMLPSEIGNGDFDPTTSDGLVKQLTDRQLDIAKKAWDTLELPEFEFKILEQLKNDVQEAKERGEDVKTVAIHFGSSKYIIPVVTKDAFTTEPRKSDEMSSDSEDDEDDEAMDVDNKAPEEAEHHDSTAPVAFYINRNGKLLGCKIDGESYSLEKPESLGNEITHQILEAIESNDHKKESVSEDEDNDNRSSRSRSIAKEMEPQHRLPSPVIPEAGPWHKVAKNLHEALQNVNYLLDQLRVMDTPYLKPLTVAETSGDEKTATNSKLYLWVAKRKALEDAVSILDIGMKHRKVDTESFEDKQAFFNELKSMREFYRLRKVGKFLTGDLGYHNFSGKYKQEEAFDVVRKSSALLEEEKKQKNEIGDTSPLAYLQVTVPCDLMRRTVMSVDIIIDNVVEKDKLTKKDDSDLEYMVVKPEDTTKIHWRKALLWAQESLICRDIFKILFTNATEANDIFSTQRENVLLISLYSNVILKIQLDFYPFKDGELPQPGIPVLNQILRQLFLSDLCIRPKQLQQFITLPMVDTQDYISGKSFVDCNKTMLKEMAQFSRNTTLLSRICKVASHYRLLQEVIEVLEKFSIMYPDPSLTWNFFRITTIETHINVVLSNKGVDAVPKQQFSIVVTDDNAIITIRIKDGKDTFECFRDPLLLQSTLRVIYGKFIINTVALHSKQWVWFVLSSNLRFAESNNTEEGNLSLVLSNVSGLYHIYFTVNYKNLSKTVTLKKNIRGDNDSTSSSSDCDDEDDGDNKAKHFKLDYESLIGSTLLRKFDFLFAVFR